MKKLHYFAEENNKNKYSEVQNKQQCLNSKRELIKKTLTFILYQELNITLTVRFSKKGKERLTGLDDARNYTNDKCNKV